MNIPNALTCLRFLMVGVFIYLVAVPANYMAAFAIYALAAITDIADGYIARKYDMVTDFGKLIDPLADKVMLITALVFFYVVRWIPLVILLFVVVKEGIMIAGGLFLYRKNVVVYSDALGKMATVAFNAGVVLTFFHEYIAPWNIYLLYIAMVLSFCAFLRYGVKNFLSYFKRRDL